jgi:hypothetical protein
MTTVEWVVVGAIVFLVTAVVVIETKNSDEHQRLMQQCMEDGKKEYECAGLLKRDRPTTIVIPTQ